MPKRIVPLTDIQVQKAKPAAEEYKLSDGLGLHVLVTPSGGKLWRLQYRFDGKQKTLALGTYPVITLAAARQWRDDAKKLLANGVDPNANKKAQKAARVEANANSFEVVAREWYARIKETWSDSHAYWVKQRLEQYVFPAIGSRPIGEIKAPEVLSVLHRIETVAAETARRVKSTMGQIFRYAVGTGRAESDPTASLKGLLAARSKKHHPALTEPKDVAVLLRAIDGYKGTFPVKCALKFAPLVFLRPGNELLHAEWTEFDLEAAEWNIPIERLKLLKRIKEERKGQKHLVPLSRQAVEILKDLQALTGGNQYVFPNARSKSRPMSNGAIKGALDGMGFKGEMTAHGFRAMARTMIHERLNLSPDAIEVQLAHVVPDKLGRAYNRTQHIAERRGMMQKWADYLDGLKAGAKVIPFRKAAL